MVSKCVVFMEMFLLWSWYVVLWWEYRVISVNEYGCGRYFFEQMVWFVVVVNVWGYGVLFWVEFVVVQFLFSERKMFSLWLICFVCEMVSVDFVFVSVVCVESRLRKLILLKWQSCCVCLVVCVVFLCVCVRLCLCLSFCVQVESVVLVWCSVCSMMLLKDVRVVFVLVLVVVMWVLVVWWLGQCYDSSGLMFVLKLLVESSCFCMFVVFREVFRVIRGQSFVVFMLIIVVVVVRFCLVVCMLGCCWSSC